MYKIIKGEVRKVRKGGVLGVFLFVCLFFWLQPILEPRYQTTLHETQTRQDSRIVTYKVKMTLRFERFEQGRMG